MCAICGWVTANPDRNLASTMSQMCQVMSHRGPDDHGILVEKLWGMPPWRVGLGHNRLSIIDLSAAGHQPMPNEDESVYVVFNGEIYNFQSLREELLAKGHRFRSKTDTEVIVHLYEEEGVGCVSRLRGMFAFGLIDLKAGRVLLARDQLGIKPLYYSANNGDLVFASELKALRLAPGLDTRIDQRALGQYLRFLYIPGPRTIFRGIQKLKPAHRLIWEKGKITEEAYWDLNFEPKLKMHPQEAKEVMLMRLRNAVQAQLNADVPVGVFLSGGLDSSMLLALISEESRHKIRTFSVGFQECSAWFNELPQAQIVAKHLQTEHYEISLGPRQFLEALPKVQEQLDEPLGDYASVPTYLLATSAREKVKVVLSGEGADELFGGYESYQRFQMDAQMSQFLQGLGPKWLKRFVRFSAHAWPIKDARVRRSILRVLYGGFPDEYPGLTRIFTEADRKKLYQDPNAVQPDCPLAALASGSSGHGVFQELVDRMLYVDTKLYLPEDLLMKIDKTTMFASLEARVPYLDQELVEWAARLDPSMKLHGKVSKWILRRAAKNLLPRQIVQREKHGFDTPLWFWLRGPLRDAFQDIVLNPHAWIFTFLRRDVVELLWREYLQTKWVDVMSGLKLWSLLCLELWYQTSKRPA